MATTLEQYGNIAGSDVVRQLELLARPMRGLRVVHVNSTRQGGGGQPGVFQKGATGGFQAVHDSGHPADRMRK